MVISPSKSKLILKLKGAAALKFARSHQVKKNGIWHWKLPDGRQHLPHSYRGGSYLSGKPFSPLAGRLTVRSSIGWRRLDGESASSSDAHAAARSWALAQGSKSGDHVLSPRRCMGSWALELDAKLASRLRQWFHKSLRAVTNLPAHLTKVSNEHLCTRFGVKETHCNAS